MCLQLLLLPWLLAGHFCCCFFLPSFFFLFSAERRRMPFIFSALCCWPRTVLDFYCRCCWCCFCSKNLPKIKCNTADLIRISIRGLRAIELFFFLLLLLLLILPLNTVVALSNSPQRGRLNLVATVNLWSSKWALIWTLNIRHKVVMVVVNWMIMMMVMITTRRWCPENELIESNWAGRTSDNVVYIRIKVLRKNHFFDFDDKVFFVESKLLNKKCKKIVSRDLLLIFKKQLKSFKSFLLDFSGVVIDDQLSSVLLLNILTHPHWKVIPLSSESFSHSRRPNCVVMCLLMFGNVCRLSKSIRGGVVLTFFEKDLPWHGLMLLARLIAILITGESGRRLGCLFTSPLYK